MTRVGRDDLHKLFTDVVREADRAGHVAVATAQVQPMLVGTPRDMAASLMGRDDGGLDPNEPIYFVADGPCGFAWVNVKAEKGEAGQVARKFMSWLKGGVSTKYPVETAFGVYGTDAQAWNQVAVNRPRTDGYYGGVSIWVGGFGQSVQRKEAYANAFAEVLNERVEGVRAYAGSRMD